MKAVHKRLVPTSTSEVARSASMTITPTSTSQPHPASTITERRRMEKAGTDQIREVPCEHLGVDQGTYDRRASKPVARLLIVELDRPGGILSSHDASELIYRVLAIQIRLAVACSRGLSRSPCREKWYQRIHRLVLEAPGTAE